MRAALYCRLSEEDRNKQSETADSESIQNQKSMLLEYAMEQGWEVYGIYSDDDYAGADRRRPQFNRLLEDAKRHCFDIILCKTQSRFTRELELVEKYIHGLFPLWGIRFISIVDNADTDNKGNKKARQINGLVNEWYLEDMSENIKSVLVSKRRQGIHIGSFALYGYRKDPVQKGHLVIDGEAAAVVREVFAMYSQGYGKTAIARKLNQRGIPNPTEYKRRCGLRYKQPESQSSTLWKYYTISDMLRNEIYIGNMVQGKYGSVSYKTKQNRPRPKEEWYIVEGTHEPIIERPLWDNVQRLLAQRSRPSAAGTIGLFAGKVRCANCGYCLCSTKSKGRYYLRCPNRYVAEGVCDGAFIAADKLEQAVLTELERLSEQYLDMDELTCQTEPAGTACAEAADRLIRELSAGEKKREEYERCMYELYLDKAKGVVSEQDFIMISKELAAERERLAQWEVRARKRLAAIEAGKEEGEEREKILARYVRPERLSRAVLEGLVDYISVGSRIPNTREVPVVVYWNF